MYENVKNGYIENLIIVALQQKCTESKELRHAQNGIKKITENCRGMTGAGTGRLIGSSETKLKNKLIISKTPHGLRVWDERCLPCDKSRSLRLQMKLFKLNVRLPFPFQPITQAKTVAGPLRIYSSSPTPSLPFFVTQCLFIYLTDFF